MNKIKQVICPGCKIQAEYNYPAVAADIAKQTKFIHYFSQKDGLEAVWVCPDCNKKVVQASNLLREIFHEELEFIHGLQIARQSQTDT